MSGTPFHEMWLSDQEFEIGRRLEKASLVIEINLDEDEIRRAQEMYGMRAAELLRVGVTPDGVIRKYPALTLAILVGQAALGYEQNRYWDEFFARLDLERDSNFEIALRHSLRRLLSRFGLRDFPELKHEYVYLMALHAGFPVYCMADIVTILEERMTAGTEVTGAAVVQWLREPGKRHRMNGLDVPVRNFVKYGDELAIDILDRTIDFIAFTVRNADWASSDIDLDTSTTGLPTLLLDRLIELLREHPFGSGRRQATPARRRRRKPTVVFSPLDAQLMVQIPYPSVDPYIPWRVSFDGTTREALAEEGWGVRADEEHPPTDVAVSSPVREILLQHQPSDENITLSVVDKSEPLLVFDLDGKWIQRHTVLPRDVVYALHPRDAAVVDTGTRNPVPHASEQTAMPGWRGWVVSELDLSAAHTIGLRRGDDGEITGNRTVRDSAAPTFEHGEPIVGLSTLNGLAVYATRPEVTIPGNLGRSDIAWTVRVKRPDSMQWLIETEYVSDEEDAVVDPFEPFDDAVLGQFEIHVAGPVGSDIRQQAFMAEGVAADYSAPFRSPVAGGFAPTTAVVTSSLDLTVSHPLIEYGVDELEKTVTVSRPGKQFRIRLTPPYVRMRADRSNEPAQWRTTAAVLTPDELDEERTLALHVPAAEAAVFELLAADGTVLRDLTPSAPRYDYFECSSRPFYDAARNHGQCKIVAQIDDANGTTTPVVLAHVRPAALCGGITIDDGCLLLRNPADEEGLAVHVWARTAPWRPVHGAPVVNGRVKLPGEYLDAGPLLVQVFVDDPWVTITPPSWPDNSAITVYQTGWMHDVDRGRDNLARFLAAEGPVPSDAITMPEVWSALTLLPQDSEDIRTQRLRSALSRILKDNPRASLEALGKSTIPRSEMMAMLIRTGLVYKRFDAVFTLNDLHPNPWVGCMVEIADLPSLWERRHWVGDERVATIDYLEDKGGQTLIELLRCGKSTDAYAAVFDRTTVVFDAMRPSQVEDIIEHARFVPGAVLDVDSRTTATIDAFHQRRLWTAEGWSSGFASATVRALDAIKRSRGQLYREVTARHESLEGVDTNTNRWMLLSLQSLTMAVLARLMAHQMLKHSISTADFDESWAYLAYLCPEMVMADLLIAEAMVTNADYGDLIGETE